MGFIRFRATDIDEADDVQGDNPLPVRDMARQSSLSAASSVAGATSSVQLLAARPTRTLATIYNDSSAVLYVKLGGTATTSDFTVLLLGNGSGVGGYYEVPAGFTGTISGVWASATGNARITELS